MDYEKLYKAYYLQVYSYTISLAKNREIAEEITQNTFYKAVSTTSQFKGKSDELTWLCSIAKNLYHDEMRSRQRVADVSEINDLPSNENVENSVADSDMAFRIHLVLHRLVGFVVRSRRFCVFHKCGYRLLLERLEYGT